MGLAILFYSFFVFLVFSRFFWFLTKSSKNIEKTKKKTKLQTLSFFRFFWFSRGFFCFWPKVAKTSRKPKKNKIADPNSPACTYMGLAFFFCFLVVFGFWPKVAKTSRKPKRKKNKIADPAHQLVPTWVLQFCFFLFFCFLEVFLAFDQKKQKHRENQKKKRVFFCFDQKYQKHRANKKQMQTLTHQLVPTWVLSSKNTAKTKNLYLHGSCNFFFLVFSRFLWFNYFYKIYRFF